MVIRGWRSVPAGASALLLTLVMTGSVSASSVFAVPAGGSLQAVLDAAPAGSLILLEPGATYTGRFVIRRAVTIRTSGDLPETRVTPAWSGSLAILASPTNEPAVRLAAGVRQVRIIGIEIAPNGLSSGTSIEIGSNVETDASRQPEDVLLDRLLVRGHAVHGQKRGLSLHGGHITVTRSHVADFKLKGQDTQAIWINNGWGPYHIEDNYLEASGENIMTGGDTPRIAQLVPSDITIVHNTIAKPLRWKSEGWTVKNLIELKSARRVTIRGNRLEGSWVSGQVGYGILLTPKDQYGKAPWTTVQDVVIESNVVHEVAEAIRILGDDHVYPAVRAARIAVRNNLLIVDRDAHGGSGRCLTVGRAPQQIEFSGNTCIVNGASAIYTYRAGDVRAVLGAVFRRNVFLHNDYGFSGDEATAGGLTALAPHYPDLVFVDNLIGGGTPSRYPGNFVVTLAEFHAQFVNYAAGDFRLSTASRTRFPAADGGIIGADLTGAVAPAPGLLPAAPEAAVRSAVRRTDSPVQAAPPARGTSPGEAAERGAMVRADVPAERAPIAAARTAAGAGQVGAATVAGALGWTAAAAAPPVPAVTPDPSISPAAIDTAMPSAVPGDDRAPAPSISLTVSAPAGPVRAHATVTLATRAAHLRAALSRVDIYIDRVPLGSAERAPFDIEWHVPAPGTYRLTAVAIDGSGAVLTSAPIDVTVR